MFVCKAAHETGHCPKVIGTPFNCFDIITGFNANPSEQLKMISYAFLPTYKMVHNLNVFAYDIESKNIHNFFGYLNCLTKTSHSEPYIEFSCQKM